MSSSPEVLVMVQARLESTRMPNKALQPVYGQPLLLWQLARMNFIQTPHRLVVALPDTEGSHQVLAPLLSRHGYHCTIFEGILPSDVLGRYAALGSSAPSLMVRICGDCPLIDPVVIDEAIQQALGVGADYVALAKEWPDGLDVEVMTAETLRLANEKATDPVDREHVTPWIWRNEQIGQFLVSCPFDLQHHCWSLDTVEDYRAISALYRTLLPTKGIGFTWIDVMVEVAQSPSLQTWATSRERNAAYIAQVAPAAASPSVTWQELRYGH